MMDPANEQTRVNVGGKVARRQADDHGFRGEIREGEVDRPAGRNSPNILSWRIQLMLLAQSPCQLRPCRPAMPSGAEMRLERFRALRQPEHPPSVSRVRGARGHRASRPPRGRRRLPVDHLVPRDRASARRAAAPRARGGGASGDGESLGERSRARGGFGRPPHRRAREQTELEADPGRFRGRAGPRMPRCPRWSGGRSLWIMPRSTPRPRAQWSSCHSSPASEVERWRNGRVRGCTSQRSPSQYAIRSQSIGTMASALFTWPMTS